MARPYALMTYAEIRQILNRSARGEQELVEGMEEVDARSIYYHTHSFYLRGKDRTDHYPNDFAHWVAEHVRDRLLAERLAMVDPSAARGLEDLRRTLISMIEDHLAAIGYSPRALFGDPFEFMVHHVVALPTGIEVRTRAELRDAIAESLPETLYWHFFEDALGSGRRTGSLVDWIAEELRDARLAEAVAGVNPYRLHLDDLRTDLLAAFDRAEVRP